ncbi:MAG: Ig-like domain repeat protein [Leucobacter sp.]
MLLALLASAVLIFGGLVAAPAAQAETAPAATATSTVTASASGLSVAVAASGLPDGQVYAAMIEKGTAWKLVDQESTDYVAFALPFPRVASGKVNFTLNAPAAKLDRTKEYELVVWKVHTAATEDNIYSLTDIPVTAAQWDTVFLSTTTAVKFSPTKPVYNGATTATVTVKGKSGTPTGTVALKIDGKTYSATLKSGSAAIKLNTAVRAGSRAATATYTSNNAAKFKNSSGKATVKVAKATPKVSIKLTKTKVTTKQNATVQVSVTVPGSLKAKAAKAKVQVFDGSKRIKNVTTNSSGKVNVKLPKLKAGSHKIKVKVVGNSNLNAKNSSSKTLKVTK